MSEVPKYNWKRLLEDAQRSEEREAFFVLERRQCFRAGVGVRMTNISTPVYFMELILKFGKQSSEVNVNALQNTLELVSQLQGRGYRVVFQDVSSFLCEREIEPRNAYEEYRAISRLSFFPPEC